ncbi:MAG: putative virulence factor, partial [Solirubrobacteraceae bacterium]|nr:putative virulence factor [Solirubrobacteraceae bacterium]
GLSKADSILNVAILNLLGKDDADRLTVVPVVDGQPGTEAALPRSLLAALTMEMTFALASPPRAAVLETVDLIDFPGYRARLQVTNLEEVRKLPDVTDPVAELILRGKVAYLFERYTDDQQMNVLLLCVPSDGQIEVPALRPALDAWVKLTQGAEAAERARAAPGLMWIVTKFDRRLEPKPGESENNLREGWDGLMSQTLLERFGTADWLREWGSGPFDNVFMVRKPGMAAGIVNCDASGREIGVDATQGDRLGLLRRTFLEREVVRKHVHDAEAAFDAMLALDDGGMTRVTAYLDRVARIEHKLARIARQVERLTEDLTQGRLGAYFRAEGAEEAERKRQIAETIVATIRGRVRDNPSSFAELLLALQPVPESLRGLYLHTEARPDPTGEAAPAKAARGTLFDPDEFDFGDSPATPQVAAAPAVGRRAAVFARAAVSDWTGRLRRMPDSPDLHRVLGLNGDVLQALVDELVTGAMRLGLEERLAAALHQAEVRAGTVRARLADQQVLVAATLLDEYVDYLGCAGLPLEQRPAWELRGQRRFVFTPPAPIAETALPALGPSPFNYSALFIMDWLSAFRALVIANAGHAAGQELTAEQNARLGRILQRIAGAALGAVSGAPAGA